ncbi:MAG: hypothetical protein V4510_11430 [bacterium]
MPGLPFVIGDASRAASALVAGGLAGYGLAAAAVAARGFRRGLADCWSTLACGITLLGCAAAMLRWGPALVPAPFGTFAVLAMAFGVLYAVLFVALRLQVAVDWTHTIVQRTFRVPIPDLAHEERRKLPHLAMGLNSLVPLGLGHAVLVVAAAAAPVVAMPGETWGNLLVARAASWHAGGEVVLFCSLLLLILVLAPIELLRLAFPGLAYPWKRIIEPLLRAREAGLFGGHLHMAAGVTFAALVLARRGDLDRAAWPTLAVILVAVFADAASALVGMRIGRTKWRHNANKSHAGTVGGTVAAFALATPLVGIPLGLATAAWFLVVDVAAPVPVAISDNLLNPIGLAALYVWGADLVQPMVGLR